MEQSADTNTLQLAVNDLVTLARKNTLSPPYQSALRTIISYMASHLPPIEDAPPAHTPDTLDTPVLDGAWLLVVDDAPNTYISLHTSMASAYNSIIANFVNDLLTEEERTTPDLDIIALLADRGVEVSLDYVPIGP